MKLAPTLALALLLQITLGAAPVEIIAHRGASADAPENTVPAARLAWVQKADAVEIDIHLSKDGEIVVIHDDSTKKTAGKNAKVKDQTFSELQQLDAGSWKGDAWKNTRIPSLNEIIETVPDNKKLVIEIKCGPEVVPYLKAILARSALKTHQIVIIGFNYETMTLVKKVMPHYQAYWLSSFKQDKKTKKWSPGVNELIRKANAAGLDGLNLSHNGPMDAKFINKVKAAGLKILVWTVNDPSDAKRLVRDGIQGITTDIPGMLRQKLK